MPEPGHDDGAAADPVERDRFGGLPREMQSGQAERIAALAEQRRRLRVDSTPGWRRKISVAEIAIGESRNTCIERGRRPFSTPSRRVVEQLLRAFEREGRDDDVAAAPESVVDRVRRAPRPTAAAACAVGRRRSFP